MLWLVLIIPFLVVLFFITSNSRLPAGLTHNIFRFTTNPDSYKTVKLPSHVTLDHITDQEGEAISKLLANSAAKR